MDISSINGLQQISYPFQMSEVVAAASVTKFPPVPAVENTQPIIVPPDPKTDSIINEMAMLETLDKYNGSVIKYSLFNANQAIRSNPLIQTMEKSHITDEQVAPSLAFIKAASQYYNNGNLSGVNALSYTFSTTA